MSSTALTPADWTSSISCLKPLDTHDLNRLNDNSTVFEDQCVRKCITKPSHGLPDDAFIDCLSYANISHYLSSASSGVTSDATVIVAKSFDTISLDVDEGYGRSLAQCMPEFCNLLTSCNATVAPSCTLGALIPDVYTVSLEAATACKRAICPNTTMNSDIAGVGACISYTVQFSLTLVFALTSGSLWICKWWQKRSIRRLKESQRMCDAAKDRRLRSLMRSLDRVDSAFDLVVDIATTFHKGVCWFAFAFSIATARLIQPGITQFNDLDQQALIIIAGCQIFTVTTMLCLKTLIRPRSVTWVDFVLSFVSWTLTLGVSPSVIEAIGDLKALSKSPGPTCGDVTVLELCKRDIIGKPGLTVTNYFITVPFMALALIVRLYRSWKDLDIQKRERVTSQARSLYETGAGIIGIGSKILPLWLQDKYKQQRAAIPTYLIKSACHRLCKAVIMFGMAVSLLALVIITGWWVISTVSSGITKQISQDWSFGQIVSVIIWAPVATDFVEKTIKWYREKKHNRKVQDLWKDWTPSSSSIHKCDYCSPGLLNGSDNFFDMTPAPTYVSHVSTPYDSSYKVQSTRPAVSVAEVYDTTPSSRAATEYFSLPTPAPLYTSDGYGRYS